MSILYRCARDHIEHDCESSDVVEAVDDMYDRPILWEAYIEHACVRCGSPVIQVVACIDCGEHQAEPGSSRCSHCAVELAREEASDLRKAISSIALVPSFFKPNPGN